MNIKFGTYSNPRKQNGDLGDRQCDKCGCKSQIYLLINEFMILCKGCLCDGIDIINNEIIESCKLVGIKK